MVKQILFMLLSLTNLNAMSQTYETVEYQSSPIGEKLCFAIQWGEFAEFQELIMQNHDSINDRDKLGNTPLIMATIKENPLLVHILLENHADPLITTPYGQTARKLAQHLHAFKTSHMEDINNDYKTLVSKKVKTEKELRYMVHVLEEIERMSSSLTNLEEIIQQLDSAH
ncbi:MAG: ankyrin repeat domain-containing protein [Candidatus Babeliales bacterium]|jgi:hypothetical protein